VQINPGLAELSRGGELVVRIMSAFEIEADEQWSYVGSKVNQRWL